MSSLQSFVSEQSCTIELHSQSRIGQVDFDGINRLTRFRHCEGSYDRLPNRKGNRFGQP